MISEHVIYLDWGNNCTSIEWLTRKYFPLSWIIRWKSEQDTNFRDSNRFEACRYDNSIVSKIRIHLRGFASRTKVYTLRFPNRIGKLNHDMILLGVNQKAKGIITRSSTIFLLFQFSFEKLIFSPLFIYIYLRFNIPSCN